MILHDWIGDAIYSVAEATIELDLSNKKNVVLSFKAKGLGNEPHPPPTGNFTSVRNFDSVSISSDGEITWRAVQSLATVGVEWEFYSVTLDSSVVALGGTYGPGFCIRFSEYDNAPAPLDGIAIDDVSVTADDDQRVLLELPAQVIEGSGPHTGYALVSFAPTAPMIVNLLASPTGQLSLPASFTIPSGQTFASFSFTVLEDDLVNLTRTVAVTPSAGGVLATAATLKILDNDVPNGSLMVPGQLTEGALPVNNATLVLDRAPTVPFTVNLTASPAGEITIPSTVTVSAGQTQAVFTVRAIDDARIDGSIQVTITASSPIFAAVAAQTTVLDNESRTLSLTLPASVLEGTATSGAVVIPGTLTSNLDVNLTSADEAALTVPTKVTILAGQTQALFPISAAENALQDGTRLVLITAAAETFSSTNRALVIRDNDVATYRFSGLSNIVNVSSPVALTVSAADVEGNIISGYTGAVSLHVVLPAGTTQPMTPASVNLSGANGWTGNVIFPSVNSAPLHLRATDGPNTGDSGPFDILRLVNVTAGDLVWDPVRSRLYASVPANAAGTNANRLVVIDPASAQISTSIFLGQDPGQLALTSGAEKLYAAHNGNGNISRINLANLTADLTFAVGVDPSYGTLYAADMCTVAGQPNLLVVSQKRLSVSPQHNGVAAYDNGVRRPTKTQDHTGSNVIEPSADPSIYFGYNTESTEYGFRRLRLDASGVTQLEVNESLINGFSLDIRSDGNKVFSTSGVEVDGAQMRRLGSFGVNGPVRPDLAANRVYFIESRDPYYYYSTYDRIGAYDPTTFSSIRKVSLPFAVTSPASFIRWGTNGLAFRSETNVVLINASQLVPSGPPADLAVTIGAAPNPALVAAPLTYTVCVSNQGPNLALAVRLAAILSDAQALQTVVASNGTTTVSGTNITVAFGDLAPGAAATLTIVTQPTSAGSIACTASATSDSVDLFYLNNTAATLVSVGFQSTIDTVNQLRLTANNLIYDPIRNRLWASIPATAPAPLGRSIVSVDPVTGLISAPVAINADPMPQCMALSLNGRYLYVGLSDSPEVHRLDLDSPGTSLRIPLGMSQWGDANYAEDIEPLPGDGTSFLMAGYDDHAAAVFDGTVRRTTRTGIYTVDRIEKTGTPGVFIGYNSYTSGYDLSRLVVNASGVSITQSVGSVISGYYVDIRGEGNVLLSSSGLLVDSGTLSLRANLGVYGRPCLDGPNQRAYIVNGNLLRGFDSTTGVAAGNFPLPTTRTDDWAETCVRWGLDGFAILGDDGRAYIGRWSGVIPPDVDSNSDGLADAWEAAYFASLNVDPAADPDSDGLCNFLEYLFARSPAHVTPNPLQASTTNVNGQTFVRLVFPRRVGLSGAYQFVISSDLSAWSEATGVIENTLATQTIEGVPIETVEALIPMPDSAVGFVRFQWLPP